MDACVGAIRRPSVAQTAGSETARRTGVFHGTLALPFTGRRKLALTYGRGTSGGVG